MRRKSGKAQGQEVEKMFSRLPVGPISAQCKRVVCAVLVCAAVAGCSPIYRNHGYVPPQEELDQIAVGIDTRASVEETLGSTGATSVLEDDAIYFVRSRVRTFAMLEPEVIEREVVAVSFDSNGIVSNVETFGLERGRPIQLTQRVTDSSVAGKSFFQQLFGNVGAIGPGSIPR
ncbi:MAG: outer membrane protein assembly factor BamE [Pseudomonadota bacterium]